MGPARALLFGPLPLHKGAVHLPAAQLIPDALLDLPVEPLPPGTRGVGWLPIGIQGQ